MGPTFLLIGKERLQKKEFIRDLQKKTFENQSDSALNTQEWDASEDGSLARALDFIRTAPFLAKNRIAVLWNVEALKPGDREKLSASLAGLPPTNILVFISEETSTKKSAFLQSLESVCALVACHTPFERDLPSWVETRAKKSGGTIEPDAARGLIERAGKETAILQGSLDALLLFVHPRTHITLNDVENFMGRSAEQDIFAVSGDLLQKNAKGALEKIERLFEEGVRAPEIIGVLAGQLERMKQAADLAERGVRPAEIASVMRVPPFFQQKFFSELKFASKPVILKMQARLLECDLMFKEGRLGERLALEKFVLES